MDMVECWMMIHFGYWSGLSLFQFPKETQGIDIGGQLQWPQSQSLAEENMDDVLFMTSIDVIFLELKRDLGFLRQRLYLRSIFACAELSIGKGVEEQGAGVLGWWEGKRGFSLNTFGQR